MKNYSIQKFWDFIEETNKKIKEKGLEIECYLKTSCGSSKYTWRINIEKGDKLYRIDLGSSKIEEMQGIYIMTTTGNYSEVHIELVNRAIKDAISFINEDEKYKKCKLRYEEYLKDCTIPSDNMLIDMIMREDANLYIYI